MDEINKQITEAVGFDTSGLMGFFVDWLSDFWPKLIGALLILWIWFKVVNLLDKWMEKLMEKAEWDPMLESFISSLVAMILKVLVIISAAWVVWVQTSSFVAMLAAAWLAIGMALSGTLQNFAGWVMILLFKPYKLWDFIDAGWHAWTVKEIHIFNTIVLTPDRKRIIIPNSNISNNSMTNFSAESKRRVDHIIGIDYGDDIDKARKVLLEIAEKEERIIQKDWITVVVWELWDNSVNLYFRFFVKSKDYFNTKCAILEEVKKTFDKKGLNFPYPQRDVHLYNEK